MRGSGLCLLTLCILLLASHTVTGIPQNGNVKKAPANAHVDQVILNLIEILEGLENNTDTLMVQLTSLSAQTASSGGLLQTLNELFLPAAEAQNAQQDALINSFTDQSKDLRHRVGRAISEAAEALDLTMSTMMDTAEVLDRLNNNFTPTDLSQTRDIHDLHQEAKDLANKNGELVQSALNNLRANLTSADNAVQGLRDQLVTERCEHGSGVFSKGNSTVSFTRPFTDIPKVMLSMTGFSAFTDGPGSAQGEELGFDQYISEVTQDSFTISVFSLTGRAPQFQKVYSTWTACQK